MIKSTIVFLLDRSVAAVTILVILVAMGLFSFINMPREMMPSVKVPVIRVFVTQPGVSPDDAETMILKPLEDRVKTISGIKKMNGYARQNMAFLVIEFNTGVNVEDALNDVARKVDLAKGDLPTDANEPIIEEFSTDESPVITLAIFSTAGLHAIMNRGSELDQALTATPSVLETNSAGLYKEQTDVLVTPRAMEQYKLTYADFSNAVRNYNQLLAVGALDNGNGRFFFKVPSLYYTLEDIGNTPIKYQNDKVIRIKDVAKIRAGFEQATTLTSANGKPAISFQVSKRTGYNMLDSIEDMKKTVVDTVASWPDAARNSFTVLWVQDNSTQINDLVDELINNIITTVLIVFLTLFIFMGFRSAVLASFIVPGTILISSSIISLMGYTLNTIVLFSLVLSIGMLVDSAIVVLEYADRRISEGSTPRDAYVEASTRMSIPIIVSVATHLCTYIPLFLWPGTVGEFMGYLPRTLTVLFVISLLLSLIYTPVLGVLWAPKHDDGAAEREFHRQVSTLGLYKYIMTRTGAEGAYARLLSWVLKKPMLIIKISIFIMVATVVAFGLFNRGTIFFPKIEPEYITIDVLSRGNYSLAEKDKFVKEVENRLPKDGSIENYLTTTRVDTQGGEVIGTFLITLVDYDKRPKADEIMAYIVNNTKDIYGISVQPRGQDIGPTSGKPFSLEVIATSDPKDFERVQKLLAYIESVSQLRNVSSTLPLPYIDIDAIPDKDAMAKAGISMQEIGATLQFLTSGALIGKYRPFTATDQVEIRLMYEDADRNLSKLNDIKVVTPSGSAPLSNFVRIEPTKTSGIITHLNGNKIYRITADVSVGSTLNDATLVVQNYINTTMPTLKYSFSGEAEDQKDAVSFLSKAFVGALLLIVVILLLQFNNYYLMFVIMFAVIMGFVGAILAVLILRTEMIIIMGGLGIIFLAGIVVNNNIVLIDAYEEYKIKKKMGTRIALIQTGFQRFRPVLLTSITAIFGLMPASFKVGLYFSERKITYDAPSSQWWELLSAMISIGLTFTSVLTLLVTPAMLILNERRKAYKRRFYKPSPAKLERQKIYGIIAFKFYRTWLVVQELVYTYLVLLLIYLEKLLKVIVSIFRPIFNSWIFRQLKKVEYGFIYVIDWLLVKLNPSEQMSYMLNKFSEQKRGKRNGIFVGILYAIFISMLDGLGDSSIITHLIKYAVLGWFFGGVVSIIWKSINKRAGYVGALIGVVFFAFRNIESIDSIALFSVAIMLVAFGSYVLVGSLFSFIKFIFGNSNKQVDTKN